MYYYIDVEVAGGLGDKTVANMDVHPPEVTKLDYQFDGWLGDDILESFPCFIVTEKLKNLLEITVLTGFQFDDVVISKSEQYFSTSSNECLPKFYWFKIIGIAGKNDFGISKDYRLVVTEKALEILRKCKIDQSDINEF